MKKGVGKALESALKDKGYPRETYQKRAEKLFSNKNRRDIYTALTLYPCLSSADVSSITGIKINTVIWHMGKLKNSGYVIERGIGNRCVYLPEGLVKAEDVGFFSLVNHQNGGGLLTVILNEPGISQGELANATSMGKQSASSVLKGLESLGSITTVTEGNHIRYYPTKYLAKAAENFYPKSKKFGDYLVKRLTDGEREEPKILKKDWTV